MKINRYNNSGFTIMEVITAVSIVMIGMIGVMSLILQNIRLQSSNLNTLVASSLVQEGLELVRNKRDSNWLDGNPWNQNLSNGFYKIDYTGAWEQVTGINQANLEINTEGFYQHDATSTSTPFNRLIEITDQGDYLDVKCRVEWNERNNVRSYEAQTYLYNWY